jgi:effector-binding domain-containing protein
MKILKWILLIVIGLIGLILVIALFLPKTLRIVSETEIIMPVEKVYYSLVTFTDRKSWDPWVSKDTTSRVTVTPVEGHVGTKYSWTSKNSGSGEMVIDSVVKNKYISLTLSFTGMSQKAQVWHDFIPGKGTAKVSWGFSQDASYPMGRIIMALIKGKLQADYDRGLGNLKKLLEEKGIEMSTLSPILVEKIPPFYAMINKGTGKLSELGPKMEEMFRDLSATIKAQRIEIVGPPFNHYLFFDANTGISVFEIGFPVNKAGKSSDGIQSIIVPGFSALEAIHTGPYTDFGSSYEKFIRHIAENNYKVATGTWEFYLTDPVTVPDEMKWKTLIAYPLK